MSIICEMCFKPHLSCRCWGTDINPLPPGCISLDDFDTTLPQNVDNGAWPAPPDDEDDDGDEIVPQPEKVL
jgi:hypothetical protein